MNRIWIALLVSLLIGQFCTVLVIMEIGDDIRVIKNRPVPDNTVLRDEIHRLTHPGTIQQRTIDWILRQGEFKGER